ncbi:MAG: DUF3006 domain-containing protein [Ruminococcaceae bacterium]|nr:DUF3006 domain-containing protein [Oscillospiraceae bacterium]
MNLTIDRIGTAEAVCEREDGSFLKIPLSALPEGAREGSVLEEADGQFRLSPEETEVRRRRMAAKLSRLFGKRR